MKRMLSAGLALLLMLTMLCCCAQAESARDITDQCKFYVSEGKSSALTNTNLRSGWAPALPDAEIRIALPENAGYIGVEWDNTPIGFVFTQYNADKEPIAATDQHESLVGISQLFHLKDGARYAGLRLTQVGQSVVRMRVYSKGELPSDVKDFLAPYDKCDLMVISTHQDDEWIFFGGIIPYY